MASTDFALARSNFVLLRAGTLRLLLPQEEVGTAAYLDPRPVAGIAPGLLQSPDVGDARTFIALSPRMGLLSQCPPDRFICAPLTTDETAAWCWSELRVLIDVALQWQELPAVLLGRNSPLSRFVLLDDAPAFACSADALVAYALGRDVDHDDAP
jgi:hypothetical protein